MNILIDEILENGVHRWSGTSNNKTWTLYCGDAEEALRNIPDESVHCIVTSPHLLITACVIMALMVRLVLKIP